MEKLNTAAVKACVFDAYGTLFDIHAPAAALAPQLGPDAAAISALWRTKQLEYTWLRSLMGRYADFGRVTADALDFALDAYNIANGALRDALLALYGRLDAYDDAAPLLKHLKGAGYKTAILSNGSPAMLHSALSAAQLEDLLDLVLSADAAGIYKPSPEVYALALTGLELQSPHEIAFVSANGWDCAGAASFGFQVIHINRFGQREERLEHGPRAHVSTLQDVTALLG